MATSFLYHNVDVSPVVAYDHPAMGKEYSNAQELCQLINKTAHELGMTHPEIIERIGCGKTIWFYWLKGTRKPTKVAFRGLETIYEELSAQLKRMKKIAEKPTESSTEN